MGTLLQDVKYGLRLYAKTAAFTLVAVLTLALGIGASTVVFSVVDAVLLKPLPYPDSNKIVMPWRLAPPNLNLGYNEIPWGRVEFQSFVQESKKFKSLGAFQGDSFNVTGSGDPIRLDGLRVSAGFFPALGVPTALGRTFSTDEDQPGHEHEVVLSYQVWQDQFGLSHDILGHDMLLNGNPYNIVGVMPAGFTFPRAEEMPAGGFTLPRVPQIWVPLALPPGPMVRGEPSELAVVGRLQPNVTIEEAQAEMDHMGKGLESQYPKFKGWFDSRVTPLDRQVAGDTRRPLLLIMGAVCVVLLITCSNVAGVLLARSSTRAREFTLRAALGASRGRMVRQLLTESLVLAFTGGLLGILLAGAGIYFLKQFGPANIPRLRETRLDLLVAGFALTIAVITGVIFGMAPAIEAARRSLIQSIKEGGSRAVGGAARIRKGFLVSEIALALVLVIVAGLLTQTLWHLLRVDAGFNPERVLTFELSLPSSRYTDQEHIVNLYRGVLDRLRAIPGVRSAGITYTLPMGGNTESTIVTIPGRPVVDPKHRPFANYTVASAGYFPAVGASILRGRDFLDSDSMTTLPVAIINNAMAKKLWPGEDPLGKQVGTPTVKEPATIIGIVADVKHLSLREAPGPEMYIPFTQKEWVPLLQMDVVLRTQADPGMVMGNARSAVQSVDPGLPLARVRTLATVVDDSVAQQRFAVILLAVFGALALVLASVGMYGVISYSVAQRTQEIGIRMAVGAQRRNVFGMILGQGARIALLGIAIGLIAAAAATRAIASFLFGIHAMDPLTFGIVSLVLVGVAVLACYVPARRAAKVDPMIALRYE